MFSQNNKTDRELNAKLYTLNFDLYICVSIFFSSSSLSLSFHYMYVLEKRTCIYKHVFYQYNRYNNIGSCDQYNNMVFNGNGKSCKF